MAPLDPVALIIRKREGGVLSSVEIHEFVRAYTEGAVPDYQMSAFLMASMLRGMTSEESFALADAMLHSGTVVDLSDIPGIKVDKHSTGGVGDKISLVLAPLVAAGGVPVPMISGRGLGHTGGTLDKLESIPGLRTDLTLAEYRKQIDALGVAMIGQTAEIAPADKKLYALRDVTGTVEFVPFIAASIMSKKLAEGIDAVVLDVKAGRGAFMEGERDARGLAETLVRIGEHFGKRTVALLTRMNEPLGRAIGNWPEVEEAIRCLRGEFVPEVTELTLALAAEMFVLGGVDDTQASGRRRADRLLQSGEALAKFASLVEAQGGDRSIIEHPDRRGPAATVLDVVASEEQNGVIVGIDARSLGYSAMRLGAGRLNVDDRVYPLAGITLAKKRGDEVQPGEPLARLHTRDAVTAERFIKSVRDAFVIGGEATAEEPVVIDAFRAGKWESDED